MTDVVTASQRALDSVFNRAGKPVVNRVLADLNVASTIVLTGVGKSYCVAQLGASLFQSVGLRATAIHATDLLHGGLGVVQRTDFMPVLVVISHSGRTCEVVRVCSELLFSSCRVVALTGDAESVLAKHGHHVLTYDAPVDGSRHGTVPSVSTTAQLAWLNVLTCAQADNITVDVMAARHPKGNLADIYERKMSERD